MLAGTVAENYLIARRSYKEYPYLVSNNEKIDVDTKKQIIKYFLYICNIFRKQSIKNKNSYKNYNKKIDNCRWKIYIINNSFCK